jgi:hypothetical protein
MKYWRVLNQLFERHPELMYITFGICALCLAAFIYLIWQYIKARKQKTAWKPSLTVAFTAYGTKASETPVSNGSATAGSGRSMLGKI